MNVRMSDIQKTQDSIKSRSLKTKYVAKRSEIDESLFGKNEIMLGIRTNKPQQN